MIEFIEKSYKSNRQETIGIFLDLKKAFDTVDHKLLITKLHNYGIRRIARTWLSSYLENRKQHVAIQNNLTYYLVELPSDLE